MTICIRARIVLSFRKFLPKPPEEEKKDENAK
jgi:hypothetical protein